MVQYFKNIIEGLVTPLQGMKITTSYIFKSKVTRRYPEQFDAYPTLPETERNRIEVAIDKCIGCLACVKACPSNCIKIEAVKVAPTDTDVPLDEKGKPKKQLISKFDIDFGLCCYCTLCEEACPTGAIYRTKIFDYSTYYRKDLLYHFSDMTPEQIENKKQVLAKYNAEKKAAEEAAKQAEQPSATN